MIKFWIRNKIMGIAVTLIALMVVTVVWTVVLVMQVGTRATIAKPGYPETVMMLVQIGDHLAKQYDVKG